MEEEWKSTSFIRKFFIEISTIEEASCWVIQLEATFNVYSYCVEFTFGIIGICVSVPIYGECDFS
jgi:hypothetical protein